MARTYFDLSHTIEVMPAIHRKTPPMRVVLRVGVTHQGPFNASFSLSVAAIPIMYVLSRRKFDLAGRLEAIILRKNFRRTKSLTL